MAELHRETVDIHSFEPVGHGWELCVYQTPQVLKVVDEALARLLVEDLYEGRAVELIWDPETALVLGRREDRL